MGINIDIDKTIIKDIVKILFIIIGIITIIDKFLIIDIDIILTI